MILGDVLLDRPFPFDDLRAAIASALSVTEDRVALVSGMENAPPLTGVTVDVTELGGEFSLQLAIYAREPPDGELVDVAAAIARRLATRVLIPSDSVDPYKMVLIQPDGAAAEVDVDTDSLDEMGEYRLAR